MGRRQAFKLAGLLSLSLLAACTRTVPAPVVYKDNPPESIRPTAPSAVPPRTANTPPPAGFSRDAPTRRHIFSSRGEPAPAAAPGPGYRVITVRPRDTLFGLGQRYGTGAAAIVQANRLQPPYRLVPGQKLRIPMLRKHIVVRGETLYGISRRYDTDVYTLARLNRLAEPYRLRPGQVLKLPARREPATRQSMNREKAIDTVKAVKPQALAQKGKHPLASVDIKTKPPVPRGGQTAFIWPVHGKVISRFGPKANGRQNDGINIAIKRNEKIRAVAPGTVVYAGNELKGFGNLVLIRHHGGYTSAYAHNARLLVRRGDKIAQGQVIALGGSSGSVTRPQLHFEIRKGRTAINPLIVLKRPSTRPMG